MVLRSLYFILCSMLCAFGATATGFILAAEKTADAAQEKTELLLSNPALVQNPAAKNESAKAIALWEKARAIWPAASESPFDLAQSLLSFSQLYSGSEQENGLLCAALRSFDEARLKSPHRPIFHIAWTDLQVQIHDRGLSCSGLGEKPALLQALDWARELAPLSINDLYWGAFVHLALDQREEAFRMLRRNQETNPFFTDEQRQYLFGLVKSERDLELLLPQRYPQVLTWIQYYEQNQPAEFDAWSEAFSRALTASLDDLEERSAGAEYSVELFGQQIKNVSASPIVLRNETLRRRLDALLAKIYAGEEEQPWARYLAGRAAADRVPALKAVLLDDRHPERDMLARWFHDLSSSNAALDYLGHTLGVYIPQGAQLTSIQINSPRAAPLFASDALRLLVSDDNLAYEPLTSGFAINQHQIDNRIKVVVTFTEWDHRFLKIVYTGSNQRPKFYGPLASLLEVFGRTAGKAAPSSQSQ
jgi:hypothetical protein